MKKKNPNISSSKFLCFLIKSNQVKSFNKLWNLGQTSAWQREDKKYMEQLSQILIAILMKLNKVQDKETIGLGSDKNIFVNAINLRAPSRQWRMWKARFVHLSVQQKLLKREGDWKLCFKNLLPRDGSPHAFVEKSPTTSRLLVFQCLNSKHLLCTCTSINTLIQWKYRGNFAFGRK